MLTDLYKEYNAEVDKKLFEALMEMYVKEPGQKIFHHAAGYD